MTEPKKIAAVVTEYRNWSHADVIVGKILEGYNYDGGAGPNLKLVSMYVDQFPDKDMSRDLAKKYGFTIYDTIDEALTLGGKELAVDGVVIVGEHGKYPSNDKGQVLYPRRRFFEEVTQRLRQGRRSRCRSSATSTWRPSGRTPSGCTTARASCSCRSWPARRCR